MHQLGLFAPTGPQPAVTPALLEFLTGTMLGDGSLELKGPRCNARYAEGSSNADYARWKADQLSRSFTVRFKERLSSPHVRTGRRYRGWWLRTLTHPLLTVWRHAWYPQGKKIVPFDLVKKHLTPFALTVWFCDDGSSAHKDGLADLYPHAFSRVEVEWLASLLMERFGLPSRLARNGNSDKTIRFSRPARNQLMEIIASVGVPPGMAYKCTFATYRPRPTGARLTWDEVDAIRAAPPSVSSASLSRQYGVTVTTITSIRKGKRWRNDQRDLALADVQAALDRGERAGHVTSWTM